MTGMTYKIVHIFTSEQAHVHGAPLYEAIVRVVAKERSAARCIVTRGVAGCFENGETASHRVLDISHNMPVKIEIVLPGPELERVLPAIEELVGDGVIVVQEGGMIVHRTTGSLLPRSARVRDVMTVPPVSVGPYDGLRQVLRVLVRSEFDGVPVTDGNGRLLGMIGQEHLIRKTGLHATPGLLAALAQGEPEAVPEADLFPPAAAGMTAGDVMTPAGETVADDDLLVDAVRLMVKNDLKRLPVLDAERHLAGMLSRIDVLRLASVGASRRQALAGYGGSVPGGTPIGKARLLEVPRVAAHAPARDVLDVIDDEGRRVAVVDADGRLEGVISDKDLLPLVDPKARHRLDGLTAADIMRPVPAVSLAETVDEALRFMVEHRRQRVPVVDTEGRYVGMLGREELLRMLAPAHDDAPSAI